MRRNTIVSALALIGFGGAANAQTVLWEQTPNDATTGTAPVYQAPSAQGYVPGGLPQPVQSPPIYYENAPRAPAPVYIDPQPAYTPPAETQPPPLWQVVPQRPAPAAPQAGPVYQVPGAQPAPPPAPVLAAPPQPAPGVDVPVARSAQPDAVRSFARELDALISLAERYRAASPGFIEDLKDLAEKYETIPLEPVTAAAGPDDPDALFGGDDNESTVAALPPPPPPPEVTPEPEEAAVAPAETAPETGEAVATVVAPAPEQVPEAEVVTTEMPGELPPTTSAIVYLRDDFADGDFVNGTNWAVRQGSWQVDPTFGLRAVSQSQRDDATITPSDLLQYLIGTDTPASETEPENNAALIEAQSSIGNAFSLVANITDHAGEGATHFIVHQGGANWLGYRLELRGGIRPLVVLTRRGASGYKDISKVEAPGLTTGKSHQLRWARLSDGQMFVLIDGKPVITARDTVFQQGWTGFGYFIAGGDVSLRNIRIVQPVEQ